MKALQQRIAPHYLPHDLRDTAVGLWWRMVYVADEIDFSSAFEELKVYVKDLEALCEDKYPLTPPTTVDAIIKN